MPNWTKEQSQAIYECGKNIIVSAGAGSGKTAVLTARVLEKLRQGVSISRLLILTFTKAAAMEMKVRIRKEIKRDATLVSQLDYLDSAYITTFDSFALSIVKKYHYILGLPKHIQIADSAMVDFEKRRILDSVMECMYQEKNSAFLNFIDSFCVKNDQMIRTSLLSMYQQLDLLFSKEKYFSAYIACFFNQEKINQDIDLYVKLIYQKIDLLRDSLSILENVCDGEYYSAVLDVLEPLLTATTYDEIVSSLCISLPRLKSGSDDCVKSAKEVLAKRIQSIKDLCSYQNIDEIKETILSTQSFVEVLIQILRTFDLEFTHYKRTEHIYEFQDIAKMAIQVLKEHEDICLEMKGQFQEIMVDEYQDTNDLQEMFIGLIATNNVYMVGDIKQSIYRFRNANPSIFKEKYEQYCLLNGGMKIDLNRNFRSRKEVLDDINLIFDLIMDLDIGGAMYRAGHEMVFGNSNYIDKGSTNQNYHMEMKTYPYSNDSVYKREEIEAFCVACDILKKVESGYLVFDKETSCLRPIRYSDCVILMDRTTDFDLYKRIFEYKKIPLTLYQDESIHHSDDILLLKNILEFCIQIYKHDFDTTFRYCFVSIMRSYLYSLSDDWIYHTLEDRKIFETDFFLKCKQISNHLVTCSIYDILKEILDVFHFYEKWITVGNVESRIMLMDQLLNTSCSLADTGYDIFDFCTYLNHILTEHYDMRFSIPLNDCDSVRMMTIHKSKGLEYPVCYFTGLYKGFNIRDMKENFLFDLEYGFIVPYKRDFIGYTIYRDLFQDRYLREEISEKIRLFYVALTRAREKMIFVFPRCENVVDIPKENGVVLKSRRMFYRSFYDMLLSIFPVLERFVEVFSIEDLGVNHDYILGMNVLKESITIIEDHLVVSDIHPSLGISRQEHFSKVNVSTIGKKEYEDISLGVRMHHYLEYLDFKNPDYSVIENVFLREKLKRFLSLPLFCDMDSAKIYKEYEFYDMVDDTEYHGVIDLMLEYIDYIDIIDYKLKDTTDDAYLKQLAGYGKYIEKICKKRVHLYLYSILDEKLVAL